MKNVQLIENLLWVGGAIGLLYGIHTFVRTHVRPISMHERQRFLKAFSMCVLLYGGGFTIIVGGLLGCLVLCTGRELNVKSCVLIAALIAIPVLVGVYEGLEGDPTTAGDSERHFDNTSHRS